MGSTGFRNPQALSSTLAIARAPQPRAFGLLSHVDPMVSVSNLYIECEQEQVLCKHFCLVHSPFPLQIRDTPKKLRANRSVTARKVISTCHSARMQQEKLKVVYSTFSDYVLQVASLASATPPVASLAALTSCHMTNLATCQRHGLT